jgi:DNA-binding transcriptional regulator YhcF (GntR family)
VQVANALRAAILTKTLQPGERLPSGAELAKQYGVARMTIQNAVDVLRDEGLIVSRQGSGVYVKERTERPVGLRPHIEHAFEASNVVIDFAGFSSETLQGALQEPLDKIRVGRLVPESIAIRILVPDMTRPMALPCEVDDLADSPAYRERGEKIMLRHTTTIVDSVQELADLGLVKSASARIRLHTVPPLFKLYLINRQDAFFGFYPVVQRRLTIQGEPHEIYDLMGKDATLFHYTRTDDTGSDDGDYIDEAQRWFDAIWTTLGRDLTP